MPSVERLFLIRKEGAAPPTAQVRARGRAECALGLPPVRPLPCPS